MLTVAHSKALDPPYLPTYLQGLRQTYYSIPLFGWLLGPWSLSAVTVIYLAFTYYVESVDSLMHRVGR